MSKLGYKQKGISMLTTPGTGIGGTVGNLLKNIAVNKQLKKEKPAGERKLKDMSSVGDGAKEYNDRVTKIYDTMRNRGNDPKSTKVEAFGSSGYGIEGSGYKDTSSNKLTGSGYDKKEDVQTTKTEPYVKKGGKATGSMKNYAIGSQGRFNEYAARGWKQDATTVVKGSSKTNTTNKKSTSAYKSVSDKIKNDTTNTNLTSNRIASNFDRFTKSKQPKIDTVSTTPSSTKTNNTKPAKIKSNKDIRKEKKANIKGGMSRQEARLKKTQSKAASAKAKTNRTIKSIDPTKAKSADTGAKQTSARTTRAKAKRLEKRAERLKGRVNASKVSK